jgi:hypothetical protein
LLPKPGGLGRLLRSSREGRRKRRRRREGRTREKWHPLPRGEPRLRREGGGRRKRS